MSATTPTGRTATSPVSATRAATSSDSCRIPSTPSTHSPDRAPTAWASSPRWCPASPDNPRDHRQSRATEVRGMAIDTVTRATETPDQPQPWSELGLTEDEYRRVREILGRRPTSSELAMYSVMWSEHCSYKSSKVHLRQFGDKAPKTDVLLVGIGENAGVVDIGEGWAVTFKVESHNHPSYVEPYQGAATGVGGIVRD